MSSWQCTACDYDNAPDADACEACGEARPAGGAAAEDPDDPYHHIKVGRVLASESIKDGKLKQLSVDVGAGAPLQIVTNAPNVHDGSLVVVACVGAEPAGIEGPVKAATVGGVLSAGMLCSPPMLGWAGGGADGAALVPDSFAPGQRPPDARPRMK